MKNEKYVRLSLIMSANTQRDLSSSIIVLGNKFLWRERWCIVCEVSIPNKKEAPLQLEEGTDIICGFTQSASPARQWARIREKNCPFTHGNLFIKSIIVHDLFSPPT